MLELTTPYGNRYVIHEGGDVQRTDLEGFTPSGQWRMLGLQHVKRRDFIPLSEVYARLPSLTLLYKNGSPQYTVRDFDHGTVRVWGNTRHHGVKHLRIL